MKVSGMMKVGLRWELGWGGCGCVDLVHVWVGYVCLGVGAWVCVWVWWWVFLSRYRCVDFVHVWVYGCARVGVLI